MRAQVSAAAAGPRRGAGPAAPVPPSALPTPTSKTTPKHTPKPRPEPEPRSSPARRAPRQARAQETVRAIVQAAAALLAERGYGGLTTNAIAERAGVSIGSLYQYFPDKRAILLVLREQHVASVRPVIERFVVRLADPAVAIEPALRAFFHELIAVHGEDPRLTRALDAAVPWTHEKVAGPRHEGDEIGRAAEILRRRPDVEVADPVAAAYVLQQATGALSRWIVHSAPEGLDREAFVDAAVRMLSGFLRPPRARRGSRHRAGR